MYCGLCDVLKISTHPVSILTVGINNLVLLSPIHLSPKTSSRQCLKFSFLYLLLKALFSVPIVFEPLKIYAPFSKYKFNISLALIPKESPQAIIAPVDVPVIMSK